MSIYAELIKVMRTIQQPVKDTEAHKYKYAKLEQVIMAIKQAVADANADLWFVQSTKTDDKQTTCLTRIFNSAGETLEFETSLQAGSKNPQESGSSKTYLKRYALLEIFAISPIGADDDGAVFMIQEKPPLVNPAQVAVLEEKLVNNPSLDMKAVVSWIEKACKIKFTNFSALTVPQYEFIIKAMEQKK